MPPVWKRHNEIKNRSALHLSAMSIQKRSIPTTGALGCSPATPAPQRLYVESDCPTVTAPVQQSQGCHSSRWHAIRPGHRSHGAHSLHTPRIHLAHEIEVTRDPKIFFHVMLVCLPIYLAVTSQKVVSPLILPISPDKSWISPTCRIDPIHLLWIRHPVRMGQDTARKLLWFVAAVVQHRPIPYQRHPRITDVAQHRMLAIGTQQRCRGSGT